MLENVNSKPLMILEIANNHMGDVKHGLDLIHSLGDVISDFRTDFDFGIKFQFRDLETFIHPDYKGSDLKYVKRFEETMLSKDDWDNLIDAVRQVRANLIATPFDEPSVERCLQLNVDFVKIASCSIADWPLVECISETKKPVIFSTAGANIEQIDAMVSYFENRAISTTMMHCVGLYPTPDSRLNLGQIAFYRNRYPNIRIGYSTHELPSMIRTGGLAYALGARVFEKHVGLVTKKYENNAYSLSPVQLKAWLLETLNSISIIGEISEKVRNSEDEIKSLRALQRGMFARRDLQAGKQIQRENIFFAIPCVDESYTANDFSKYTKFTLKENLKPREAVTKRNTEDKNNRSEIIEIVESIRKFANEARVRVPEGSLLEISHHYGIDKFYSTGMASITVVNEEYCKKLLFLLPNQLHPEQFHKTKKETFHVIFGSVQLTIDGVSVLLNPGETQTIEPGVRHIFTTQNGCIIEEISTTHVASDSFYIDKNIQKNLNRKTIVNFWS